MMQTLGLNLNTIKVLLFIILITLAGMHTRGVHAFVCELDTNGDNVGDSTAGASSGNFSRLACGNTASAAGTDSTALGRSASAAGSQSTALGRGASAAENGSTAVGQSSSAAGVSSTAVGQDADVDGASNDAIALGHDALIVSAPGGIAIGADLNNDGTGATATAAGAIAIGADVVADIPNTLVTNVPILARDPDTTVVPRTMFEISGFGNTKFTVTNADANEQWAFANPGTGFRLSRQGSGQVEFEVKNNGNAVLAGTLTQNSDFNEKHDIQPLDQQAILDKVMELDISEWRYNDDPDSKHIGPMAQDFYNTFELGHTDKGISSLDSSGVALAAIQALKQENEKLKSEKNSEIEKLEYTVTSQGTEITELKSQIVSIQRQLLEIKEIKQHLASLVAMTENVRLTQVVSE